MTGHTSSYDELAVAENHRLAYAWCNLGKAYSSIWQMCKDLEDMIKNFEDRHQQETEDRIKNMTLHDTIFQLAAFVTSHLQLGSCC